MSFKRGIPALCFASLLILSGCTTLLLQGKAPPSPSDFELVLQTSHGSNIHNVEYNMDGTRLYSFSSGEQTVKLWDMERGRLIRNMEGVIAMDYDAVNNLLFIARPNSVELYRADGKTLVSRFTRNLRIYDLMVHPSGDQCMLLGESDRNGEKISVLEFLDIEKKQKEPETLWRYDSKRSYYDFSYIYSADGKYAATSANDGEIKIWNSRNGTLEHILSCREPDGITLRFNENSSLILSGNRDNSFSVYDIDKNILITRVEVPINDFADEYISSIIFTPDGTQFITTNTQRGLGGQPQDPSIRVWDAADYSLIQEIEVPQRGIGTACFHPSGKMLATGADDFSIKIWRYGTKEEVFSFGPIIKKINSYDYSENLRTLVSGSGFWNPIPTAQNNSSSMNIWNLDKGSMTKGFGSSRAYISLIEIEEENKTFTAFYSNTLAKRDIQQGMLEKEYSVNQAYRWKMTSAENALSPDHRFYALYDSTRKRYKTDVWDFIEGRLVASLDGIPIAFSADNQSLIMVETESVNSKTIVLKDIDTGTVISSIPYKSRWDTGPVLYSPRNDLIIIGSAEILLYDPVTGTRVGSIPSPLEEEEIFISISLSPDEEILAAHRGDKIYLYDLQSGELRKTVNGHKVGGYRLFEDDTKSLISFSHDNRKLIYPSWEDTLIIQDIETERWMQMITSVDDQWLIITDDGYFDSSAAGGALLGITHENESYSLEQFSLRLNRPDIILSRLESSDQNRIEGYKTEYLKRLIQAGRIPSEIRKKDLGAALWEEFSAQEAFIKLYTQKRNTFFLRSDSSFSDKFECLRIPAFLSFVEDALEKGFHTPEVHITSLEQRDNYADVTLEFSDSLHEVVSYNIYMNGVPLYPQPGRSLAGKKATVHETVELIPGTNRIEAVCVNSNAVESIKKPYSVEYAGTEKGDLFFFGFGVNEYQDESIDDLIYPVKDVRDMAELFSTFSHEYRGIITRSYTNEDCTMESLDEAEKILREAKSIDTVVIFISGHGIHEDAERDPLQPYYFLPSSARIDKLAETAIPFAEIEKLLVSTPARKKLMFMDTCESGEFPLSKVTDSKSGITDSSVKLRAVRKVTGGSSQNRSSEDDRSYLLERNRYIFNDLFMRSGTIVFSSSQGDEFSLEPAAYKETENGFFTGAILKALGDRGADENMDMKVDMFELENYVTKEVSDRAELFHHSQTPVIDRDNPYIKDHIIWEMEW